MPKGEYLLEVRAEEIPARMLAPATAELVEGLVEALTARGLAPTSSSVGFTPRRLVVVLKGLPEREEDREEQMIGPPARIAFDDDGEPTQAALGFAKRCGVEADALERTTTDKGEYLAATVKTVGSDTGEVLAELAPRVLAGLSWPKSMRWGDGAGPWVRPVHGIVSTFSGAVVPFDLFDVTAGDETVGHPVLSPDAFTVKGAADYRRKLSRRGIEVLPEERRQILLAEMRERAAALGGVLVEDDELLDKLTAMCEIPGVMEGTFSEGFLGLPREVLIASLKDHQSAFTIEGEAEEEGAERPLLPYYLTVMDRPDDPAGRVRAGNEWVVAARLEDGRFFFDEDRKRSLADRAGDLDRLTFHERLGTYADKAERIAELSRLLCEQLGWQGEIDAAVTAAGLLKADLPSEMVKEFTSLQGIMGGLYARLEGVDRAVWQAIYDQYLPASTDDPLPRGRIGKITALADRIDSLVGIFGLGLIPTGSRDPFGLRRAAQGAVRITLEGRLPLDLDLVAARAALLYGERLERSGEEILSDLRPFLHDRTRYLLGLKGYAYDEIEAALAVGGNDLPDLEARVDALHRVRDEKGFLSVVLAAKRIANIVKDHNEYSLDPEVFAEDAERDLHDAFQALRSQIEEAAAAGEYERGLRRIADLAEVLDRFFVEVLVMDEDRDRRRNRIALLQAIHRVISRTARLTEVVVDRAEHRSRFEEDES
ncbi:MAG: glycine--tRNA ligase subunit beta [Acidobacteriota bacterium]